MKKVLSVFLAVFALFIFQCSFAAEVTVYTTWSQGAIKTDSESQGTHNNKVCSIPNCPGGGWHCPICGCGVNHYNNGDYDKVPVCDCASTFKPGTVPAGYKYVRSGSESKPHSCENLDGMQQQSITCTWYYSIYESSETKTSPSPTPSPSSNIGGGIGDPGESPSPSPTSTPCPHSDLGSRGDHHHKTDVGSRATASSRRFGSTIDTEESYRRENPFNIGEPFKLTVDGHIAGSVVHIPEPVSWTCGGYDEVYCRDCGATMSRTDCTASGTYMDWTANTPTFTDTYHDVIMSFEGFTVDGSSSINFSHLSSTYSGGSQKPFSSTRISADYIITSLKPSELKEDDGKYGDKSSGLVNYDEPRNNNQVRNSGSGQGGFWQGVGNNYGRYPGGGSFWEWGFPDFGSNNPIPGGGSNHPNPGGGSNNPNPGDDDSGTPVGNGNNTPSAPSAPTGKSGLLYGYVYVQCDCGCTRDKYRIYFDLTPVLPPTENKYTLTVKADGAPITGGVKINGDSDYKDYSQKEAPIGDRSFSIDAQANEEKGYKFDAWYKTNGDKYSKIKSRPIVMPGFNFTLIAKFLAEERYNVTIYSDGNGDVKFDGKYDDGQKGWEIYANVIKGDDVGAIAIPNDGYVVDYWELINDNSNLGTEEKLQLNDVRGNYIILVHFKPINPSVGEYKQLITTSVGDGIAIGGTDYAIPGNHYPIWAIPSNGSWFYLWTHQLGGGADKVSQYGAEDIIKMPNDRYKLVAYFDPYDDEIYHLVIVESDGNGDISINEEDRRGKDSINVVDGTEITIKAYPDEGYEFEYWEDEDNNIVSREEESKIKVTEDKVYIAHFKYTGDDITYSLNVESAGGGRVYRDVEEARAGEEYLIRAIPNENCEFLYWADKETEEITDYAEYDYIIMPERDITLVAHFREGGIIEDKDKYKLTLKTEGSGTATGAGYYEPDTSVDIKATPGSGYEFVGWYEDNQLISTLRHPSITMPYYDMTLTAVFRKADDNSENSPFKILSIRDVRWKDYFTSNGTTTNRELYVPMGANSNTILVNEAKLVDNSFSQHRDIVYGYAVEFELVTTGIKKNDSKLVVIPKVYEKTSSGRMNEISIDLGDYARIDSSRDTEKFMITGEEKTIEMPNDKTAPQVTWRWVWYLPLDIYEEICDKVGRNSDIVVNFEIYVETSAGQMFDYVQAINYLNRSEWGGNVFTYRLDKTLLTDIYDNATN